VDYCSAAFLLVRRSLFERLNWLDDTFAPAYYEDTDLCMRIRQTGFRVIYDPEVEIFHFEFANAESSSQAIALQQRHKPIFYQRYAVTLKKLHFAPGTPPLYARMTGRHAGRILVIDDQVPYRTLGGGCPRARSLLAAIHEAGWFITLYPLMFPNVSWDEAYRLLPREIEIMADHGGAALPFFLASRAGYYDAVLVSRPNTCPNSSRPSQIFPSSWQEQN
jgi:hypothetical protein